ncbi:enoyl-CoA hydratase/isomerase family protein [Halalkalibacter akibai]|uniref:Enoyl-CoA hydratase n=1 Tax=Halalkalibacter akibai (strain ATCC 43226 / DSM 21942 / CIP 109018 / JCM 9157 / 1139) TaxID=1236973 RepID=W4QQG9_HALA3|nr:enoyl-CoA hydratase/isomerase family protein [Halalkalibacter akibai]GAE33579.1 enoyl-CoA hydratase [Halalkalibacter akibai JCM 9157]
MTNSIILYAVENRIATITLNRPQVKNALNKALHDELYQAFEQAKLDPEVGVIVLQGSANAFCAGADLKSIPVEEMNSFDYGTYLDETYNRLIRQMVSIEKPIVANMNGIAVGAGLSIALACDYRVANADVQMGLGFLKIGLVPDAGASYFLPRLVGLGKANELALGGMISAEEAYRINLINGIGNLDDLLQQLVKMPRKAFGLMKANFRASFESNLEQVLNLEVEAQRQAGQTKEHKMAIQHFLSR